MPESATASPVITGRLLESGPTRVVLAFPGTDYKIQLEVAEELSARVGQNVTGTIHARAQRVDVIEAGGRFVEPWSGRPRRVQGRLIGGDVAANAIQVQAGRGIVLICVLTDTRQRVADFMMHQMVSFDVEPGATFKMES